MEVKLLDLEPQTSALREEYRRAIDEVIDTQAFILGPAVGRFEQALAGYCQTRHAIAVSSGTDALLCAMMAMGIGAGDEVIVPSFTFFASAGCIARLGARPVFCDIDPRTFNADPASIERCITPKTKAIMPVHLFGQMADMQAINAIAERRGLPVIEDAAQAIGARQNDRPACSVGSVGCLSFYPTKNLGAIGDAGAICTNDDEIARKAKLLRVHGSGHTYHHEMVGGMFRMATIQAAILEVKLKHLDSWHEARRRNAAIYEEVLAGSPVVAPFITPGNYSIFNQYVVRVANRDAVRKHLAEKQIGSAIYYPLPLHMQECFAYLGHRQGDFPESEKAASQVLALPVYPELTEAQVRFAATQLREAAGKAS